MKLLFLAPEPFFQERGTPIAVRLALEVLAKRANDGDKIDLVTYHEGTDITIPGVSIHRINAPRWLSGVGPGISCKKILCDIFFLFTVLKLLIRNRKSQYNLIHAVEESVFLALFIKLAIGIPYIYDMDSSLTAQLTEKWRILKPLVFIFKALEAFAIRQSESVVPVCDALAVIAETQGAKATTILRDISLIDDRERSPQTSLREELGLSPDQEIILYIGNLERYQGIDLLIDSFKVVAERNESSILVIIGGSPEHIAFYKTRATAYGISERVRIIGPRPVANLGHYIKSATILVSPRSVGNNTPMKIYSYLHSGVPIVATNLTTHTQVLNSDVAVLCNPTADDFAACIMRLLSNPDERARIGRNAAALAEEKYTFAVFERDLNSIYDRIAALFPSINHSISQQSKEIGESNAA